jgi:non-ribosomal peptide synthetase component F
VEGKEAEVPELPVQYGDFTLWQQTVGREAEAADLQHWLARLAGVPPLELPTDHPRPAEKGTSSAEVFHPMGGDLARAVTQLARSARGTPFMVLLAGIQALLGGWSGQDDFCLGSPVAGRTAVELEPVVGLFANMVALRADLSGDPTFRELLARTRPLVIDALSRQNVPFGRIVTGLDLPREPNRTQVFQVIFNMRTDNELKQPDLAGLWIEDFPHGHPKVLHDLVIDIWRLDGDVLRTGFRYDTTLFTAETVTALARRYERLLWTVAANPDVRLSAFEKLSD